MDLIIAPYSVTMENADKAPINDIAQYATDGNPAQGIPATILPAHVVNAIVAEIVNAIKAGGKTPDRNNWNQLADIINDIMKKVGGDDDYFLKLKSETNQTVDSDVKFVKFVETENQTVNGDINMRGIGRSNDKTKVGKMFRQWISDDVSGWMNVEQDIGEGTNIVFGVQDGQKIGYFRFSNLGKFTCDSIITNILQTNNQLIYGNVDIYCPTNNDTGINVSNPINYHVRSYRAWTNAEEIIGKEINYVIAVQGAKDPAYFRFNEYGKFTCNDIQIIKSISCDTLTTNDQTVNGDINMRGIGRSDDKTKVGKMFRQWISDDVSGWMNVEQDIGEGTNIVFGVQDGQKTGYFRFNNLGKFTCDSIQTNTINTNSLDVSENINAKTIDASGTVTVNDNVLNINSSNKDMNENGLIVANASIHFNLVNRTGQTGGIYLQEDFKNNKTDLVFYVGNSFYTMDDQGTLTGKNFNGVSMSAFCADLAEYYIADEKYDPGTLVKIGGEKEITKASIGGFFYGIISTSPAYEMNTAIRDEKNALPVALAGRIPVLMTGMIDKGDPVTISEISGVARKAGEGEKYIGFSLENSHETSIRLVECVIKQN